VQLNSLRTIVSNAGGEGSAALSKVMEGKKDFGYNAKKTEYTDMLPEIY
jgi:chaperonin GroEL